MQEYNKEMFSINDRISQMLDYFNITRYRFSHETGISETVLLNIYKGKNKPSFDVIEKILNHYPAINAEWLLTGKGEMHRTVENKKDKPVYDLSKNEQGIPFIHLSAVGEMFSSEWRVAETDYKTYVVPIFKGVDFLTGVEGSGMSPRYAPGDIVACKKLPVNTFFQWNMVYVLDTDQGALIKRIKKGKTDDTLLIVSENTDYEPFEINRSQIYHIAIVSGVIHIE